MRQVTKIEFDAYRRNVERAVTGLAKQIKKLETDLRTAKIKIRNLDGQKIKLGHYPPPHLFYLGGDRQYAPDVIQFAGHCPAFTMAIRVVPDIGVQYDCRCL